MGSNNGFVFGSREIEIEIEIEKFLTKFFWLKT